MKIALIDMDGTLCDYAGSMQRELVRLLGETANMHDPSLKNLVDLVKRQPGFWRNLPVIDKGMKVVGLIKDTGFETHVLTKGPWKTTSAWTEKVEWCREYLPGTPVTITEDKGLVYGRILFDDWPPYCESWLAYRPRGLVLMPAYDYNKGFDEKYPEQVVRVTGDNWEQVKSAIQRAAERLPREAL